jgi:hypothetical protein
LVITPDKKEAAMSRLSFLILLAAIGVTGCGKPARTPAEAKGPPVQFTQNKLPTFGAPGEAGPPPPMFAKRK